MTIAIYGTDLFGDVIQPKASGVVKQRFVMPPFTILDAKQGEWQDRKRAWATIGIKGELGRDAAAYGDASQWQARTVKGANCTAGANSCMLGATKTENEGQCVTSIFDPVVCELAYRWFSPKGGQIVDPFAGGSVRGIVAGALGRKYWGCDLRAEQVAANEQQANEIETECKPEWVCGDSTNMLDAAPDADFIFSCPPYGDLEVYSDDPADLSNMEWHTFVAAYKRIILRAVKKMKPDTFACFVVGDFRDAKGFYRNFVSETIDGFQQCGAMLYNEAILATATGSAAMRVTKQFNTSRKLVKTHQNILVFCKGDPRAATAKLDVFTD